MENGKNNTMKGGDKENMETKTVETKVLFEVCPMCKKEITGYTENQVKYNLRLHLEKHSRNPTKKEE